MRLSWNVSGQMDTNCAAETGITPLSQLWKAVERHNCTGRCPTLGHWVDFLEKVERPSANLGTDKEGNGYAALPDRYHSRPNREKEHFAHAYAERLCEQLGAIGAIPFGRELRREQLMQDALRLHDFISPSLHNAAKDG